MAEITGVLLAAGFSTRFGANKLLHAIEGRALIEHSAAALSCCDRVIAIVRRQAALERALQSLDVECIVNPEPERGMGRSIALGVAAAPASAGWCLLPADMPFVPEEITLRVVDALRAGEVLAAPMYGASRGHPVGFGAVYYDALRMLDGDRGARGILERNRERLCAITTANAGVLTDVDRIEDLHGVRA